MPWSQDSGRVPQNASVREQKGARAAAIQRCLRVEDHAAVEKTASAKPRLAVPLSGRLKCAPGGRIDMSSTDSLLAPIKGADHREIGSVQLDVARAGAGRVKRMIYPPGFRWSSHMKAIVGTDLCQHAHVGFLAHGEIYVRYGDGCVVEFAAPQFVAIEPGHDGWVVGNEPAVLIEFDFEGETAKRFGIPEQHRHVPS